MQEKLDRYQEHRQRLADLKKRRHKAYQQMKGEEELRAVVLDVAYMLCDES